MTVNRKLLFVGLAVLAIGPACLCAGLTEGIIPSDTGVSEPAVESAPGSTTVTVTCDSRASAIDPDQAYAGRIEATDQGYPDNCNYYCLQIPDGTGNLSISLTDFDVDLDLYVGYGEFDSVFGEEIAEGETFEWKSNEFGTADEFVSISNPATPGPYYIEVCSFESLASDYSVSTSAQ